MSWLVIPIGLVLFVGAILGFSRARRNFDAMVAPSPDLRRADDGARRSLAEHDGTGGFV